MERVKVHPETPQPRFIQQVADIISIRDGIALYPTDTVYGVGCCVSNTKRLKDIVKILHRDESRKFSFLCSSIAQAQEYVKINNEAYRILKKYLPGPYTFILPATNVVKKKISQKRKAVGIRIPANPVLSALLKEVNEPIANMSLNISGENRGDPELFMTPDVVNGVDVMLDAGPVEWADGSTIVDLTEEPPVLLRQGKGEWNE